MTAVFIVGIVFCSIIIIVAIVFGFALTMARIKRGGSLREGEQFQADETRLIQEIHRGLSRMEDRVEALETILLDRDDDNETRTKARKDES